MNKLLSYLNVKMVLAIIIIFYSGQLLPVSFVYVQGPSSVGKTSLLDEIKKKKGKWKILGSLYWQYSKRYFKRLFPKEFYLLEKVFSPKNLQLAINLNQFTFKPFVAEKHKKEAHLIIANIQKYFDNSEDRILQNEFYSGFKNYRLHKISSYLKNGYNLATGTVWADIKEEELSALGVNGKIFFVLAYCPFNILIPRIIERNKIAASKKDPSSARFFKDGLRTFFNFFEFTDKSEGAIETISKAEIIKTIVLVESFYTSRAPQKKVSEEYSFEQFQEYKHNLLHKFEQHDELFVVPKIKYDYLIRTDLYSPSECMQQMMKLFP